MFMNELGWKRQKASQYYENGFDLADPPKGPLGTLKIRGPRLEDHGDDGSSWTASACLAHSPGPSSCLGLVSSLCVQWEGCEPDLVSSCHLISCVTLGFGHLMFLSLFPHSCAGG